MNAYTPLGPWITSLLYLSAERWADVKESSSTLTSNPPKPNCSQAVSLNSLSPLNSFFIKPCLALLGVAFGIGLLIGAESLRSNCEAQDPNLGAENQGCHCPLNSCGYLVLILSRHGYYKISAVMVTLVFTVIGMDRDWCDIKPHTF